MVNIAEVRADAEKRLKQIQESAYLDPVDVWDKSDFFRAVILLCEGYQARHVEYVAGTADAISYLYKKGHAAPAATFRAVAARYIKKLKEKIRCKR